MNAGPSRLGRPVSPQSHPWHRHLNIRGLVATFSAAVAEALANRRGLTMKVTVMITNDLAWVGFWYLFFAEVGMVRGWDTSLVLVLFSVLTTTAGIVLGVFHNVRNIAALVADGGLDATLSLPVPTLPHLLSRRVDPINIGDVIFGVVLFAVAARPGPAEIGWFILTVTLAAILLGSFIVLLGSLSFFTGRNEAGELGMNALIVLASYPVDMFNGIVKGVLYTALPAGFVAAVPARVITDPDPSLLAALAALSLGFALSATIVFYRGLRRYSSGTAWHDA